MKKRNAALIILFVMRFALPTVAENESAKQAQQAFSFVQMCDTQLGMGGYEHDVKMFKLAVAKINHLKPDFVVICGDLVGKANDKSFADFNTIRGGFNVPCHCAAGNHDVENKPTAESLRKYREKIGDDYYSFQHKGFTFVVANTQLWKAPLAGESEKHDTWFKETLEKAKSEESPVIVVVHFPFFTKDPDEKDHYFNLPLEKRKELLALCEKSNVVAILGGHTHKFTENEYKGMKLVNGETTSKNFDGRPMGFRWWDVDKNRSLSHRFMSVEEPATDQKP
ncbi:MAG: metallophosphoesterase [Akkermansiaceae bacterium]